MKTVHAQETPRNLSGRLAFSAHSWAGASRCKNSAILDLGCGFGWFLAYALRSGAISVDGLELSEYDLRVARADAELDKSARLMAGSALCLPYPDNAFDLVTAWEVLEHIPPNTEQKMLSEVCRVLRPGGTFCMSTPLDSLRSSYTDPAYWLSGHRHYTEERLRVFARNSGLRVEQVTVRGRLAELISIYNLYIAKWIFRRPPFLQVAQDAWVNKEWKVEGGYMNIFVRATKPVF